MIIWHLKRLFSAHLHLSKFTKYGLQPAKTLWPAWVARCELTSRISTVFHERILPHHPSKLHEKAQNLSITLSNVIHSSFFFAFFSQNSFFLTQPHHFFTQFTTIYTTFTNKSLKHLDNINVTNKYYTMINKLLNFHSKLLQLLFIITLPHVIYHIIMS